MSFCPQGYDAGIAMVSGDVHATPSVMQDTQPFQHQGITPPKTWVKPFHIHKLKLRKPMKPASGQRNVYFLLVQLA